MKYKDMQDQDELGGRRFAGQAFHRLLPYVGPHKAVLALSLFCIAIVTGVSLYTPLLLGKIVDHALLPKDQNKLYQLALLFGGLELMRVLLQFTQAVLLQRLGQRIMHAIRQDLFGHLLRMPIPFFDQNPVGRLVTRVTNDTSNLSELFGAGFISFLADISLVVGVLCMMLAIDWRLGLMGISAFPLMVICMIFFSGRLQNSFRNSRRALAIVNGFFAERMSGMIISQMMGREAHEHKRYQQLSLEYRDRQFDSVYLYSLFHPAITVLSATSMACAIYYGGQIVRDGGIALGTFVAFLAYIQTLYQPVRSLTDKYNIYLAAVASAERIFGLMDMAEEEGLRTTRDASLALQGALEFRDVSFRYKPDAKLALHQVSFAMKQGEHIAIVGATGAGKSTLISLLFRFYEVSSGEIFIDGKPLAALAKSELRRRIGFVQQDVFLFAGSIRENLQILAPEAPDAEILRVATRTGFLEVLGRLPQGLDTMLDERGVNLSLGERQILAVTRTLLQSPEILVLDEATASVDPLAEAKIQSATEALLQGRSSLIIAHRLSTVEHADRILVFDQGRLVESGTHLQLQTAGGVYAELLKLQDWT